MINSHTTFTKREIYVNEILFYSKHEIQLLRYTPGWKVFRNPVSDNP